MPVEGSFDVLGATAHLLAAYLIALQVVDGDYLVVICGFQTGDALVPSVSSRVR